MGDDEAFFNDFRLLNVGLRISDHGRLLALAPVTRSSARMCHRDDLDPLVEHTIDNEERKSAQQNAPGATDVRRPGFGPV